MSDWKKLCGIAVKICGSQEAFKKEAAILKRLVRQYGAGDVEVMLKGAQVLKWRSLTSLGSKEGLGRRWAVEAYWREHNAQRKWKAPERLKSVLWNIANEEGA